MVAVHDKWCWPFCDVPSKDVEAALHDAARELGWIKTQGHLRPDEKLKLLVDYEGRSVPLVREAIRQLLMMQFCNVTLAKADNGQAA